MIERSKSVRREWKRETRNAKFYFILAIVMTILFLLK